MQKMRSDDKNSTTGRTNQQLGSGQEGVSHPAETANETSTHKSAPSEEIPESESPIPTLHIIEELDGPLFIIWGAIEPPLFEEALKFVKRYRELDRLNVLVHSLGGSPNMAFKTAVVLRSVSSQLIVYVPRQAKSAATLLSLIANKIVLFPGSELGPLDTQVKDPRNSLDWTSALIGSKALDAVANFLHQEKHLAIEQFLRYGANMADAVNYALRFAKIIADPLFSQFDPLELGNLRRSLDIGRRYAVMLLIRTELEPREAYAVAERLAVGYPSHDFVIDYEEADRIGLRVHRPDTSETNLIGEAYNRIRTRGIESYYGVYQDLE